MSRNLPPTLFRASVKVPIPSVGDPPNQRTAQAFLTTRVWVTEWLLETRYRQREARNKNVFLLLAITRQKLRSDPISRCAGRGARRSVNRRYH